MWTRVLTWDSKWIYILTHFVKKGAVKPRTFTLYPEQNDKKSKIAPQEGFQESVKAMESNPAVVATALSKCVFKAGRKTIAPMQMFKYSGILPEDAIDETLSENFSRNNSIVSSLSSNSEFSTRRSSLVCSEMDPHTRRSSLSTDASVDLTEMEKIEKERRRGMKAAAFLSGNGQQALEMEFTAEDEALGKHTDGCGVVGVVSTLAQLAGLKKHQIL